MKTLLALLLITIPIFSQSVPTRSRSYGNSSCVLGPYMGASNFTVDLLDQIDHVEALNAKANGEPTKISAAPRAELWGGRDAFAFEIKYNPPANYRVRILRQHGTLTGRTTTFGVSSSRPAEGKFVGVLVALANKFPSQGSVRADILADDTYVYEQADIGDSGVIGAGYLPFHGEQADVVNNLLGEEHILYVVVAKYLDETGMWTHLEPTISQIVYEFVNQDCIGN